MGSDCIGFRLLLIFLLLLADKLMSKQEFIQAPGKTLVKGIKMCRIKKVCISYVAA